MLFTSTLAKIAAVVAISQVALAAPTSSKANVKKQSLNTHNKYRTKHHVPKVKWSSKLAKHAQKVSDSCVWGHNVMDGTGQNIAYGYPSMKAVVDAWYNEVSNYNYKTGNAKGNGMIGHFTQVVWKGTTHVGCAATKCPNLGGTYYVCDYSPPGNYIGDYTNNVFSP